MATVEKGVMTTNECSHLSSFSLVRLICVIYAGCGSHSALRPLMASCASPVRADAPDFSTLRADPVWICSPATPGNYTGIEIATGGGGTL